MHAHTCLHTHAHTQPHTHKHTHVRTHAQLTLHVLSPSSGEEHKEAVSQHCKLVMETQGKMKEAFQVQEKGGT